MCLIQSLTGVCRGETFILQTNWDGAPDANSWRVWNMQQRIHQHLETRLQYWTFHCWLKTLYFTLSVVLSSHLYFSGPPWWHRPGLTGFMWHICNPSSYLNHSHGVLLLWEAVTKLCVWYLFMVQFPPACSNFFICKIPAWNSLDDSCVAAVTCSWDPSGTGRVKFSQSLPVLA